MKVVILGIEGRVGSAVAAAFRHEGWEVSGLATFEDLPAGDVLVDAGLPGRTGYHPPDWQNYFGAVERAVRLIGLAERAHYRAVVLCSTPWISVRQADPYADSKMLIEQIAQAHNRHGDTFVVVDRIGMQAASEVGSASRFEESVRQGPGQLGERIVASVLLAIDTSVQQQSLRHAIESGTLRHSSSYQPQK